MSFFYIFLIIGPINLFLKKLKLANFDNFNLPLTRRSFCFPLNHFYINLSSITQTYTLSTRQVEKMTVYCSLKHWYILATVYSLSLLFCQFNLNVVSSTVYLSKWKFEVSIFTCINSPSHFLIFCYLLRIPDNSISAISNLFRFSWSCQESIVDHLLQCLSKIETCYWWSLF